MKYKIFYHLGDNLSFKTKAKLGHLFVSENDIYIEESNLNKLKIEGVTNVELTKFLGGGHCIKVYLNDSIIYLSVIRFCLFNMFITVNLRKTIRLFEQFKKIYL